MKISRLTTQLRILQSRIAHQALRLSGEGVARGDVRYEARDWHRAYRAYRTHLISHPHDGKVWSKVADCAMRVGDFAGGFYSLRQALLLEPNDVTVLVETARQYKDRGYLLTARACLARARRLDPTLPLEAFERAVASSPSVESGHRLLLDVTDMFAFFRLNVRKTGMQRVQAEVMTSLIERNVDGDIVFTFFNDALGNYRIAPTLLACELVDASNADAITVEQLEVILTQIFGHAEPLKCRNGDFYLVLGAFWFGRGYLARLDDLRREGATVGINFFDLIPYTHPEYVDVATQRDFTGKLEEALSSIDYACTNSAFVAGELRKLLASLGRKNVPVGPVPLAHDISVSGDAQLVSDAFKKTVPQEYVLCVGTIERRKNHALLLQVWKRLYAQYGDNVPSLVIVGKWGWRIEEFRDRLTASKNVHSKILVREGLADSELEYLYRNCLFTVFPSFTEGWGLPVGESLYFGKPCLASNSSSIPEVGGDLVRYFDPQNEDEAYRMIDATLSDRRDLAAWTERVRTNFKPRSWDQVTDDLMDKIFKLSAIAKGNPAPLHVETIEYSVSGLKCRGQLIYDDAATTTRPMLLVAPNWLGITPRTIEAAKLLAGDRYVIFVADMYGEGGQPAGTENPMEFLEPLINDAAETRRRIVAALAAMVQEGVGRGIGDAKRCAAFGYCFGGANVLDLARAGADIAAVASFHGNLKTKMPAEPGGVKAVVLVIHGAADPIAPKSDRDALEEEMTAAGARWHMMTFGGVYHSFTDEKASRAGISQYSEPAMRHGYELAHAFIEDAFRGKL